ncbi:hypothetical protein EFL95_06085 [Nocardioides marmorisolisilvae]|uniref:Fenitrothion hydrolase n=1 Tax=Nocardioides marmorisolisilvae TaxID=1542737 RepID=A0A3N0DXH7_9ACTN|nr:hypothetical protein EFL95_06085 [Nocardioides marmorisolisilvae]
MVGPVVPLHGLGGAKDLPIPAPLAIAGGTAALVVSFCVLILAWRNPRYDGKGELGRPLPREVARTIDSPWFEGGLRLLGLIFGGYIVWAMVAGPDLVTNPVFGTFYVILWVGIVPSSVLFGRFFRAVSPVRTLNLLFAKATGSDPAKGLYAYPERLGYWPAAAGLFAFVWQELVNPRSAYLGASGLHPGVMTWVVGYFLIMLIGSALFGDAWLSRADPFEVYSDLLAKLSPWARDQRGALVLRSPLANLATLTPRPGLVATVAVLFGSTAFDSYKDSVRWVRFVDKLNVDVQVVNTLALLAACSIIAITFALATMSTGVDPSSEAGSHRRTLPLLFAHSVVPIIVGYMTAHYLSYFVEQGQITVLQLSDPMANGSNLFGTADWSVDYWLSFHPTTLACIKVLAVVAGHIVGVIAAHDRALALLPKKHQVTGQLGLLVIMVAYTGTGLYLLFGA